MLISCNWLIKSNKCVLELRFWVYLIFVLVTVFFSPDLTCNPIIYNYLN